MNDISIPVEGMTCAACALRIERKLNKTDGVEEAAVNYATEEAIIRVDSSRTSFSDLVSVIQKTGYGVKLSLAETHLSGVNASQRGDELQALLEQTNGVVHVDKSDSVDGTTVALTYVQSVLPGSKVASIFTTFSPDTSSSLTQEETPVSGLIKWNSTTFQLGLAVVFSIPLAIIAMSHGLIHVPNSGLVQFFLALPVVVISGRPFFSGAWNALKHGATDMNTLISLGVLAAFGYSVGAVFFPTVFIQQQGEMPEVYFEAAALIITLILLGRFLEERAKKKTGAAIRVLLDLQPNTVSAVINGQDVQKDISEVEIGMNVRIRPGERIPVDALILEGSSYVDESMLTGENAPVLKAVGERTAAGTINGNGSLLVEIIRTGKDTILNQIIELVKKSASSKAPIQKLADRISAVFVPAVIALAVITAIMWMLLGPEPVLNHALLRFVSVIIIACPCALGLATPTAIVVGMGRAARMGILIKNAEALQRANDIDVVALDKTGTITTGTPKVSGVYPASPWTAEELIQRAAAVETHSEHPLGKAIVAEATSSGQTVAASSSFSVETGKGVQGTVGSSLVSVGSAVFLKELGVEIEKVDLPADASSQFFVSIDGVYAGRIAVGDSIRPEAAHTVKRLLGEGIRVVMLTGDTEESAQRIARQIGIEEVHAGLLPAGKVNILKDLQGKGNRVAMIGDGINDAPVLAAADIGFAVRSGSDIAIETADVTLMSNDLSLVFSAFHLSRRTMKTIRQNLFFAFIYNVICIPIAAGLLYPVWGFLLSPILASAAMALSSVSVVTNSLRLKRL